MKPLPDWAEAYDRVRAYLGSGESHASRPLELAELGLAESSPDVMKALGFLKSEGLIASRHGKLYPTSRPARSVRRTSFFSDYQRAGRTPSLQTFMLDLVPVQDLETEIASLFDLSDTRLVIRHHHLQKIDGIPYAIALSYLPYDILGNLYSHLRDASTDLYLMMTEAGYKPTRKRETLRMDVPTREERKLLTLEALDRVMVVRLDGVVWSNDRIVEVCRLCDRADLYEFTYEVALVEPTAQHEAK